MVHFEVVDDTDAFFLHTLTVDEKEYGSVRSSQSLLVDFAGFTPHVLSLLEQVRSSGHGGAKRCVGAKHLRKLPLAQRSASSKTRGCNTALLCLLPPPPAPSPPAASPPFHLPSPPALIK